MNPNEEESKESKEQEEWPENVKRGETKERTREDIETQQNMDSLLSDLMSRRLRIEQRLQNLEEHHSRVEVVRHMRQSFDEKIQHFQANMQDLDQDLESFEKDVKKFKEDHEREGEAS